MYLKGDDGEKFACDLAQKFVTAALELVTLQDFENFTS